MKKVWLSRRQKEPSNIFSGTEKEAGVCIDVTTRRYGRGELEPSFRTPTWSTVYTFPTYQKNGMTVAVTLTHSVPPLESDTRVRAHTHTHAHALHLSLPHTQAHTYNAFVDASVRRGTRPANSLFSCLQELS